MVMKRNEITRKMLGAFVAIALVLSACDPDNGGENNGGEGGNNQGDPSTANVIPNAVKDIDGNVYDAVKIGNQVWMASNLRTTRYADGMSIPLGETTSYTDPYRYAPGTSQSNNENMVNVPAYGYLYNWSAVMHGAETSDANPSGVQGICPNGWHVPSDAEWTELTEYMKTRPEYTYDGYSNNIAKALAATWGWESSSAPEDVGHEQSTTNNATGFSALPAGIYRGWYDSFGYNAHFLSSTESASNGAWIHGLASYKGSVDWFGGSKNFAFSVRCLRD